MKDAGISLHQALGFWQEIQEEYVLCETCWLASGFGPFLGQANARRDVENYRSVDGLLATNSLILGL